MADNRGVWVLRFTRSCLIGLAVAAMSTAAAFAQKTPAPQQHTAPVQAATEPETTTATYGAWVLRCQRRQDGGTETRICEVDQGIVPQGQQNPVAQIGIGRPSAKDELHLTAVMPTNVTFPSTPKISAGEKDQGVELVWRRCLPGACVADAVLKEDTLRAWRGETADNAGHLVFTDAAGRPVNVQFSLRGFAQAMDALAKEK
jgi:invasion protein IalB